MLNLLKKLLAPKPKAEWPLAFAWQTGRKLPELIIICVWGRKVAFGFRLTRRTDRRIWSRSVN